ncbi:SWF/SNF helicase family protein [Photobacterium frigidiphilum]|uniref:helicase-related protein n=1 Tax=Photobacterium frigidiphilum TaxID=264736 RepID=UPI003D099A01
MNQPSSKLNEALQLVKEAREGQHRILVFSQFVTLLKMFSDQLEADGINYSYLDGKSSSRQRKQARSGG